MEDLELELLLTALAERYGYDFRLYAQASLKRRLRHAMMAANTRNFSELQAKVLHDPKAFDELIVNVSVHVTAMFRDPLFYLALRQHVVPHLRTYPIVRVWVAGCATGEEVHSLAILMDEEGLLERCRIYATDLSDTLLQRAASGVYPLSVLRAYTQNYQRSGGKRAFSDYYRAAPERAVFSERLREHVVFSRHNLASDSSFNEFNLILCRNVMIYFGPELRERVHDLLHSSLARSGILAVGLKESLAYTKLASDYEAVVEEQRIYRRVR